MKESRIDDRSINRGPVQHRINDTCIAKNALKTTPKQSIHLPLSDKRQHSKRVCVRERERKVLFTDKS